jgi:hypothetical protein
LRIGHRLWQSRTAQIESPSRGSNSAGASEAFVEGGLIGPRYASHAPIPSLLARLPLRRPQAELEPMRLANSAGTATHQGAGLHFKGVTTSGVPLLELTQPDAVRLQGFPSL